MLKKSLIPAALVALSSTSVFADAESFHMGLKGLYFKPKASEALEAVNKNSATKGAEKSASEGGILLVGPQFGYYISDSIRVGVAGYMGFGEFKSTFTIKAKNNNNTLPKFASAQDAGGALSLIRMGSTLAANGLSNVTRLKAYIDAQNNTVDSKVVLIPVYNAQAADPGQSLVNIALDAADRVLVNPTAAPVAAVKDGMMNQMQNLAAEAVRLTLPGTGIADLTPGTLAGGKTANLQIAEIAVASALLSPTEREINNTVFKWILSGKDIAEQKQRAADVAETLKNVQDGLTSPSAALAALVVDPTNGTATSADTTTGNVAKDEGKWIETLAPKGVILATVDAKLFENDVFSLGAGVGVGATNWKATWKLESTETGKKESDYTDLPSKKEASKWALAGMGTVNASVTLGDVATLTGHVGYAHLGKPEGLTYGDAKGSSSKTISTDETRSQGWVFGVGIGKDF